MRHGGIPNEREGVTFRRHDLLQTVAFHQEFFIPFLSAEIVFFLDVDNCPMYARDTLRGCWLADDNWMSITVAHFDNHIW